MSQSSALFRRESKISNKNQQKSSLPKIQPQQNSINKFLTPSPLKIAFKNVRKLGRNHQQASNLAFKQVKVDNDEKKISNDHYEHLSRLHRVFGKDIPNVDEKQLTTACTLSIEQEMSSNSDIKQTDLKGMQMWALNKNLKQFSETRKVAFFKSNPQNPNEISSTMSKNRTQQVRSMYKIQCRIAGKLEKGKPQTERGAKKMDEIMLKRKHSHRQTNQQYTYFSKNKLPSAFLENSLYGTLPIRKQKSDRNSGSFNKGKKAFSEQKIDAPNPQTNSYLKTFINGSHLKRQLSKKKIEDLEGRGCTPKAVNGEEVNNEKSRQKKSRNLRRNRFQKILLEQNQFSQNVTSTTDTNNNPNILNDSNHQSPTTSQQALLFTFQLTPPSKKSLVESPSNHFQEKKSQYQYSRSIQKINNSLLRNIDNYMDDYQTHSTILPSKIQFIVDSLGYPKSNGQNGQFRSTHRVGKGMGRLGDEFFFEDDNKEVQKQQKGLQNKCNKKKVGCKN